MPCMPFTLPGGSRGFICSRTPVPRCGCGNRSAFQCDAPSNRRSGTCDRHLCGRCAKEVGPDQHVCPAHAELAPAPAQQALAF